MCVCVCVCVCVRSFLQPRASSYRPRNIGAYVFTATRKTLIYIYIYIKTFLNFKMNKEVGMLQPQISTNTSGVGKNISYCEDIIPPYNNNH